MTGSSAYRFGPFTLDIDERRLSAGGDTVRLSPKAFDLLATLVQHRARLLTKHELLARVWPDVFVDEGILTVHVAALRKALNDDTRRPSYIETVPGTGYRFVAALERDVVDECSPSLDPPRSVELYELVGRGRLHLLSASHAQLPLAVDAFRAAVARDPTYAPAHAGLARARCTKAVLRAAPHRDAFADAKASALRALALDRSSADAHVALGTLQFLAEWDWSEAERSLQRALHVNPDHTEALLQYGSLHDALGRLDEGLQLKQRGLTRDPRSPLVIVHIALSYSHQRRYEEALAWARRALEIDASHLLASVFVAFIYWTIGDIDGFVAENIRAAIARHVPEEELASLKQAHARMRQMYVAKGFAGWSQFMANQISNRNPDELSSTASRRAVLYAAAGRLDQAFACLDEAIGTRDPAIVYLGVAPQWDALRADRRFADRLHAISLNAAR
jgi:DNA-binding winged helix-turn-helix (wHTH) protein/Tfp pilus assembly protein PilF